MSQLYLRTLISSVLVGALLSGSCGKKKSGGGSSSDDNGNSLGTLLDATDVTNLVAFGVSSNSGSNSGANAGLNLATTTPVPSPGMVDSDLVGLKVDGVLIPLSITKPASDGRLGYRGAITPYNTKNYIFLTSYSYYRSAVALDAKGNKCETVAIEKASGKIYCIAGVRIVRPKRESAVAIFEDESGESMSFIGEVSTEATGWSSKYGVYRLTFAAGKMQLTSALEEQELPSEIVMNRDGTIVAVFSDPTATGATVKIAAQGGDFKLLDKGGGSCLVADDEGNFFRWNHNDDENFLEKLNPKNEPLTWTKVHSLKRLREEKYFDFICERSHLFGGTLTLIGEEIIDGDFESVRGMSLRVPIAGAEPDAPSSNAIYEELEGFQFVSTSLSSESAGDDRFFISGIDEKFFLSLILFQPLATPKIISLVAPGGDLQLASWFYNKASGSFTVYGERKNDRKIVVRSFTLTNSTSSPVAVKEVVVPAGSMYNMFSF